MTDRELLEAAARAAGMPERFTRIRWEDEYWPGDGADPRSGVLVFHTGSHCQELWNPLEDDGDALRLAVALRLDIVFGANYVIVNGDVQQPTVNNANDPMAATRRAIVRAAAAIGAQSGAPQPPGPDTI